MLLFYLIFLLGAIIIKPGWLIYLMSVLPIIPILIFVLINKTELALLFYLVIMPVLQHFSTIFVPVGSFLITPDIVIHIFLLIAVLNNFIYTYDPASKRKINLLDKLLLLFVLMSVFSLISASAYPTDQGKRLLLYYTGIFQTVTLYFMILYFLDKDAGYIEKLILTLLLIPLSSGIVAIIELKDIGLNLIKIFLVRNQIGFGFHNTNLFGIEAALLFPIFFFALTHKNFKNIRILLWPGFIALSVLSALTLNRGTFLVVFFYLFIFAFRKENRKIVFAFLIIGIIGAFYLSDLISIYINRFLGNNASNSNISLDQSALYRIELWKVGLKAVINYPLGLGGNGYNYVWRQYGIDPTHFWSSPHQILLHIAIDYGLPALLVFLFLYYRFYRAASRLTKILNLKYNGLFFYIKVALIGYMIQGFLTGTEISHLSGAIYPTNGYTYLLIVLFAIISFYYGTYTADNIGKVKTSI